MTDDAKEKRKSQKRAAARTFRANHPEKIKSYNQTYYKENQQEILEGLRQKRIDDIDPDGVWVHVSQIAAESDLPQNFNHVERDCQCKGRWCKGCERAKCISWFYQDRRRPDVLTTLCKLCYGDRVKQYKQNNKEAVDASTARYIAQTKQKRRNYWLKRLYGLTEEQYQEMLTKQNGCCAMCGNIPEKTLHVDHDHTTGRVRSLLCTRCNSLIGYANDSIDRLYQAVAYLEAHQKES